MTGRSKIFRIDRKSDQEKLKEIFKSPGWGHGDGFPKTKWMAWKNCYEVKTLYVGLTTDIFNLLDENEFKMVGISQFPFSSNRDYYLSFRICRLDEYDKRACYY